MYHWYLYCGTQLSSVLFSLSVCSLFVVLVMHLCTAVDCWLLSDCRLFDMKSTSKGKPGLKKKRRQTSTGQKKTQEWHAVTADLQSVSSTRCRNVSTLYYSRKLSVYSITVYNQHTGDGYCMLWDETQGHRGANEIHASDEELGPEC